jgi:hypothetical protein
MNHEIDHERLLADALADSAPAGFRETMLRQTLKLARRRRRFRQTRRVAAALVALCAVTALLWKTSPYWLFAPRLRSSSYELVRTQSLPAGAIITTRPLAADRLIASVMTANVVHSSDGIRELSDDELLALVAPKPAVLIRLGPNSDYLVFANPEDEKGFPVNRVAPRP